MLGPRLDGAGGVSLRAPTLDDTKLFQRMQAQPETTRFWGPRFGEFTDARAEERFKRQAASPSSVSWSIYFGEEPVGFTGIFDIDWVRRDGESGLFIGRHDLYGRGIASEAVRLRTAFAWRELRLHRVHNWIALTNRGSRRANEKSGYREIGRFERAWFRSGEWTTEWLGEALGPAEPSPPPPPAPTSASLSPGTTREDARHVSFTDKTLTCKDCGQEFIWTSGEQEFYASRGLTNEPGRCPACRAARRAGGGAGTGGGFGGRGASGPREFFTAVCSNCGGEARVPFQPRGDKPVYCSNCFEQVRPSSGGGRGRY